MGTVWVVTADNQGEQDQVPKLYGAAVAAVVLLYAVGGCSGCCVGLCRVEKFFDDGWDVRMMDVGEFQSMGAKKEEGAEGAEGGEECSFEQGLERGWFSSGGKYGSASTAVV